MAKTKTITIMATIGIICDSYKTRMFERKLKAQKYAFEVNKSFKRGLALFKIDCDLKEQPKIAKICQQCEIHFQALKN